MSGEAPGARTPVLEVALRGERTIRVHGEFDGQTLLDLVSALETSC